MATAQILVPLDGSVLAEQALSCATMLAQGLPAELVLFRAISLPSEVEKILDQIEPKRDAPMAPLETEAHNYLNQVSERLQEIDLKVSTVVRCGPAADTILDYAEQTGIQQIVMATHGYSGISRWMHGSVAERVLLSARVPVLLIRALDKEKDSSFEPIVCRRILVPLDGSPVAEQVLTPAASVARAINAEIILLRVLTAHPTISLLGECYVPVDDIIRMERLDAQPYLEQIAKSLHKQGISTSTATEVGGVASTIIEYAETNQIELIAMCTHGRTGLARWTLGSVADRALRAGSIPLLLVRAR